MVGYVVSSAPSRGAEHYPRLPPVLSTCVLEALLAPENYIPRNAAKFRDERTAMRGGWFQEFINGMFPSFDAIVLKALAYPVCIAADMWRDRSFCADDRIRDIAMIEHASSERIRRLDDGVWLFNLYPAIMGIDEILSACGGVDDLSSCEMHAASIIACTVSLLVSGEADEVIKFSEDIAAVTKVHDWSAECGTLFLLPGCCSAYSSIMCRRWESMKLGSISGRHTAAAFTIEDKFPPILDSLVQHVKSNDWQAIDIIIQCCAILGDGLCLLRLSKKVVPFMIQSTMAQTQNSVSIRLSKLMARLIDASEIPTVRVINLRRRPDRALDFMACAVHKNQLIVIKAPSRLRSKRLIAASRNKAKASCISPNEEDKEYCGDYAFDGQCSRDELEKQLTQRLDGIGTLTDFVEDRWRPSELKAFDKVARGDFELVKISMTERACAMSHIAR